MPGPRGIARRNTQMRARFPLRPYLGWTGNHEQASVTEPIASRTRPPGRRVPARGSRRRPCTRPAHSPAMSCIGAFSASPRGVCHTRGFGSERAVFIGFPRGYPASPQRSATCLWVLGTMALAVPSSQSFPRLPSPNQNNTQDSNGTREVGGENSRTLWDSVNTTLDRHRSTPGHSQGP